LRLFKFIFKGNEAFVKIRRLLEDFMNTTRLFEDFFRGIEAFSRIVRLFK
jgi:hypothetical protein